jgi:DNA-binding CsgD family transcriptional regulator
MAPLLIERAGEIDQLQHARRSLLTGLGAFVHIVGQAGVGKTSLLDLASADLRAHGVLVLSVRADETDRRRPLGIVRRLLPDTLAANDPTDDALAALERCAAAGPVALVVDDLHWADERSLDVVSAIARRVSDLGVFLACAAWPQTSNVHLRLEELAGSEGICLRPHALDAAGLAALVELRLGVSPGRRLAAALEDTAGNPFLACELLSSWLGDARLVIDGSHAELAADAPLVGELSRRLASRALAAVPDAELILLAIAATPGGARADELAELLERPLADVVPVVLDVVESGVLVDTGDALTFRHDLLRRAVLDTAPRSVLGSLGRRLADVLLRTNADPDRVTACLVGNVGPDQPPDVDRFVDVARRFRPTHPAAAAELLRTALDTLDAFDPRSDELTVELGWALVAAGRSLEVSPLLTERLGPHRRGEPTDVRRLRGISASLGGQLELVAAHYADIEPGNLADHFDAADREVVDAFAELGLLRVSTGRIADAATIVEWVERSPTPGSPFRTATVATVRAFVAAVEGSFETAEADARTALAAAASDPTARATTATPNLVLAMTLDLLGRGDEALAEARRGLRHSTPRWGPPLLQFFSTLVLYRRGQWDDALAEVDASLIAAEETQLAMAAFWPSSVATLISCARDRSGSAREWLGRSQKQSGQPSLGAEWLAHAAATVADAEGDTDTALAWSQLMIDGIAAAGAPAMFLNGGPELVRRCVLAGRHESAAQVVAALESVRARTASPVAAAVARWSRGLLDGDALAIEDAADELVLAQRRPESIRALHHAAVIAARSDHDEARRLAKLALAGIDDLDAQQWRRQLVADLRVERLHLRPRRRPARAVAGWSSLTASEEAVVALVGDGLTNTEIAERLFVSRRTVESHLRRVYPKLGLSTRPQLVAAVLRRTADHRPPSAAAT